MRILGAILRPTLVIILISLLLCSNSAILPLTTTSSLNEQDLSCDNTEQMQSKSMSTRGSNRAWAVDRLMDGIDASNITFNQLYPTFTSDNDRNLYCAWQDIRNGDWDIFFSKSTNFGLTWDDDTLVTNSTTSGGHQIYPAIARGLMLEPEIFLVWQDMRDDDGDIYFSYSIDDGETWANEIQVNTKSSAVTPPRQWYPAIATDDKGRIYVVWADDSNGDWDIMMSYSTNKGITWSEPVMVNDQASAVRTFNQTRPSLGVDAGGVIYVAWEDERESEKQIYLTHSVDGGKTFSSDKSISKWKVNTNYRNPKIVVLGNGDIFAVWEEDIFSKYNVMFSKSLNSGTSFSTPIQINNETNKCSPEASPELAVDDKGNIFVSWSDQRDNNHIYMGSSIDNGNTFSVNEVIDDADDTPATPISVTTQEELERGQQRVTLLNNKIYAIWTDYRDDPNPDNAVPENGNLYLDWNQTPANRVPAKINFDADKTTKGWDHINLSWPASKDVDFSKYLVYKSTVEDFEPELLYLNVTINDRNQNYVNLTNLTSSTTYYFYLIVEDIGGLTNRSDKYTLSTNANIPPVIDIIEPDGKLDLVDSSYEISWFDSDPDDNATIKLYYDKNQIPTDGRTLITMVPYGEDSAMDFYTWDTREVPNGSYFISAIISDYVNGDQLPIYSKGKVTIFHGNLDPLIILFRTPLNTTNVGLTEAISVRFNKDVDMATVTSNSYYVSDSFGSKVSGEFSYNSSSNIIKLSPINRWNGSEKYTVHITTAITDSSGLFKLANEYSWWFETEEYIVPKSTIFGEVVEAYKNEHKDPIAGVNITLTDKANISNVLTATTDSSGMFILTVVYGTYELTAHKESYQDLGKIEVIANKTNIDVPIELVRPVIIEISIKGKIRVDEEFKVSVVAVHPKNEKIDYFWDFGDGTVKPGQNITHKYKETGAYTITLTAQDEKEGYITYSETVEVEQAEDEFNYFLWAIIFVLIICLIGLLVVLIMVRRVRQRRLKEAEARWEEEHELEHEGRAELEDEEGALEEDFEEGEEIEVEDEDKEADEEETIDDMTEDAMDEELELEVEDEEPITEEELVADEEPVEEEAEPLESEEPIEEEVSELPLKKEFEEDKTLEPGDLLRGKKKSVKKGKKIKPSRSHPDKKKFSKKNTKHVTKKHKTKSKTNLRQKGKPKSTKKLKKSE